MGRDQIIVRVARSEVWQPTTWSTRGRTKGGARLARADV